jgi:Spy/CpxP family protein refolding chaperone
MKQRVVSVMTIIAIAGVMVGLGTLGFAQPDAGYGQHWAQMDKGEAAGYQSGCRGQNYPHGYDYSELTDEQRKKLDEERRTFDSTNRDLRQEIYRKRLLLKVELAGKNADQKKASALQKELSDLEADLDQKRLVHWFKIKEIAPDFDAGCLGFGQKGRGHRGGGAW